VRERESKSMTNAEERERERVEKGKIAKKGGNDKTKE